MKAKKVLITIICAAVLIGFTGYVLMDTFVITRAYASVAEAESNLSTSSGNFESESAAADDKNAGTDDNSESESAADDENNQTDQQKESGSGSVDDSQDINSNSNNGNESEEADADTANENPEITATSYKDENISIELKEYDALGTSVYVADVQLSSAEYLKTALASGTYGKNIKAATSEIAQENNAILAINGDFYGSRNSGYVLRNGAAYRDAASDDQEDLVIYKDGSFGIINESDTTLEELVNAGAWNILSFGPAIVQNGEISVGENEEVGRAMASNPRTAIGIIDELHYVFVVSDGRTSEDDGLTLYQLAQVMKELGAETAYNLDGGGSSTMYFNGQVVNNPTSGRSIKERSVSDIVYIG